MTGWRVGWVVIPQSEEIGQIYENIIQYSTSGVAGFMQHGCLTAVSEGDAYIADLVERCRVGRDIVCDALQQLPDIDFVRPRGAFYLFFRVAGETNSLAFAKRIIDQANVGLAPGMAFGPGGEGFQRICFASSHQTLRAGVERLVAALR
jgi:aspartate/methionine/tyrosine aminotransferase